MGRHGYRTSGLSVRDKFVTDSVQPEFLDVGIRRLVEHNVKCTIERPMRGRGRVRDLLD